MSAALFTVDLPTDNFTAKNINKKIQIIELSFYACG